MSNTLTYLIPTLYEALNVVSREMIGFIPAVFRHSRMERAAKNQVINVPIAPAATTEDITPGVNPADSGDQTPTNVQLTMTRFKASPVRWEGEEQMAVGSTGLYNQLLADQFAESMRALANLIEVDLYTTAKSNASRAYGTAGTTPFGTAGDLSDLGQIALILDDNGCPVGNRQMVLSNASIANLRGKQSTLFKVNEAGSSDMLRDGMTDRLQNFAIRQSGGISLHTKGTGASYLVNNASGYAAGSTTIALDTGSGTVLAGDIVTFAADSVNKFVVNTALSGGNIVIGKPGVRSTAIPDNNAMTVGNNYTGNFAFHRNAIVLGTRLPAVPTGGDSADDSMVVTDPVSGISFEIRIYRQYRRIKFEVCIAWGYGAVNGQHIATLLG